MSKSRLIKSLGVLAVPAGLLLVFSVPAQATVVARPAASVAPAASVILCEIDQPDPPRLGQYNEVSATAIISCNQEPDVFNWTLSVTANGKESGETVSSNPGWSAGGIFGGVIGSDSVGAGVCQHGVRYQLHVAAEAWHGNWAKYSANSGQKVLC